jgi:glycosyltransferase involved in cell wall biosynthesis
MKLMIAIPVYNRREYLEITEKSLYECSNINKAAVKVFNDCSSEFDNNYLKKLFNKPNAEIINREKNLRADRNTYQIMLDFLNTDNDVLFICDADLLLRPDTIDYIFNSFKRTDGFLGLYNSELHRDIYFDGEFVYKENVGFAGICISRSILQQFITNQKERPRSMDFKLSAFLIKSNVRLMIPRNCYVQHIGFDGQNSGLSSVEFSTNFIPSSDFNKTIINKMMPIVLKMQAEMIKHLLFKDKYKRHGFMLHQPLKCFEQNKTIRKLEKMYFKRYPCLT